MKFIIKFQNWEKYCQPRRSRGWQCLFWRVTIWYITLSTICYLIYYTEYFHFLICNDVYVYKSMYWPKWCNIQKNRSKFSKNFKIPKFSTNEIYHKISKLSKQISKFHKISKISKNSVFINIYQMSCVSFPHRWLNGFWEEKQFNTQLMTNLPPFKIIMCNHLRFWLGR
jgi:hypothetical protein